MSLYKVSFSTGANFSFTNNGSNSFTAYFSGRLSNSYYYGNVVVLYSGNSLTISGGSTTPYASVAAIVDGIVCCYVDTRTIGSGWESNSYYFYLNESGKFVREVLLPNQTYNVTFSDTPSSGLSQLTVQGNNLSSVSYNNQNYTTFPATLPLDSSVTTLNVNGRVSSQRIN